MAYVHVGHDCVVGDRTILVNNTALAGHVHVGDWAILSGYTLVHQYCRVGAHAFTGMGTAIGKNLPAYVMADRKSTRLNSSHVAISYAVFCLKKKTKVKIH